MTDDKALQPLIDELDAWAADGREATLWWRDDDAADATPALERLLSIQGAHEVPLGLAAVPMAATASLAARVGATSGIAALQHGYAHRNHAPDGEKKVELGPHRRADHVIAELAMGRQRMEDLFGSRALPVLVPPWNRIAPYLVPMLPELGYAGLSAFTPRRRARPVAGLIEANTHADVLDWKPRGFPGAAVAARRIADHLAARRRREVPDPDEPTGILTHHLVHDDAVWAFLAALIDSLSAHPAARWLSPADLFMTGPGT